MKYNHQNKTITTERLLLRLFQKSDAVTVAKLCHNYNLYKSTLNLPYPYALEDALTWMEPHFEHFNTDQSYTFAMTDKEDGTLYGAVGLSNHQAFNHGEMGYWIGEEFWGNGYATEAAQAILEFAFNEKDYHKVFARCFHSNPASGRVLQKIGMKKEGVLREHIKKKNRYEDLVIMASLKDDSE